MLKMLKNSILKVELSIMFFKNLLAQNGLHVDEILI
jgi:hypothetical protein